MSSDTYSSVILIAGAAPFGLLGAAHLIFALLDLRTPRNFAPVDESLIQLMHRTGVRMTAKAPGARSLWATWIGVNLTHALGLLSFAGLLVLVGTADVHIAALPWVAAVIAAAYSAISFRFFFITPGVVTALGAALLVAASFG